MNTIMLILINILLLNVIIYLVIASMEKYNTHGYMTDKRYYLSKVSNIIEEYCYNTMTLNANELQYKINHQNELLKKDNTNEASVKLENTSRVLDIISGQINYGSVQIINSYRIANKYYDQVRFSDDVTAISSDTLSSIIAFLNTSPIALSTDYIVKYINTETTRVFLEEVSKYNRQLELLSNL